MVLTDLSTECGSGPIQLARARYRTTRRLVADLPPHCMNAPQRTCRPKSKVHKRWINFHSWTPGPSFIARWSYRITHRVVCAVKKAAKLNILFMARRLKAHPSARATSQLTHLAWENVTTDVTCGGPVCSDQPWMSVHGRLYNIYYTDVHATGLGHPLCRQLAAVQPSRWLAHVVRQVMAQEFNWPGRVGGSVSLSQMCGLQTRLLANADPHQF